MTKEQEKNLNALNTMIGYGNPKAKYWFLGIEEGGNVWDDTNNDLLNEYVTLYKKKTGGNPNKGYPLANEDLKNQIGGYSPFLDVIKNSIDNSNVDSNKGKVFRFNLYPLGNKKFNEEYPEHYHRLFGIKNRKDYEVGEFLEKRIELLKTFIKENLDDSTEKFLFCLGINCWEQYISLLGKIHPGIKFEDGHFKVKAIDTDLYKHAKMKQVKIYLLYHPRSLRLTSKQIKELL